MSGFILKRNDGGQPVYWCPKVGKKFGSPMGGWVPDKQEALSFERKEDAEQVQEMFGAALGATVVIAKALIPGG